MLRFHNACDFKRAGFKNEMTGSCVPRQCHTPAAHVFQVVAGSLGVFRLGAVLDSLGYRCASIMQQMRDERLEQMFATVRSRMRQTVIPKWPVSRSIRKLLTWPSDENVLAIYIGQRSETWAIVNFMGLPTSTATGAVKIASVKGTAPANPSYVSTLRLGTLPECRESNLYRSHCSSAKVMPASSRPTSQPSIAVDSDFR